MSPSPGRPPPPGTPPGPAPVRGMRSHPGLGDGAAHLHPAPGERRAPPQSLQQRTGSPAQEGLGEQPQALRAPPSSPPPRGTQRPSAPAGTRVCAHMHTRVLVPPAPLGGVCQVSSPPQLGRAPSPALSFHCCCRSCSDCHHPAAGMDVTIPGKLPAGAPAPAGPGAGAGWGRRCRTRVRVETERRKGKGGTRSGKGEKRGGTGEAGEGEQRAARRGGPGALAPRGRAHGSPTPAPQQPRQRRARPRQLPAAAPPRCQRPGSAAGDPLARGGSLQPGVPVRGTARPAAVLPLLPAPHPAPCPGGSLAPPRPGGPGTVFPVPTVRSPRLPRDGRGDGAAARGRARRRGPGTLRTLRTPHGRGLAPHGRGRAPGGGPHVPAGLTRQQREAGGRWEDPPAPFTARRPQNREGRRTVSRNMWKIKRD